MTIQQFIQRLSDENVHNVSYTSVHRMITSGAIVARRVRRNPILPETFGNSRYDISEDEYQRIVKTYKGGNEHAKNDAEEVS